MHYVMPLDEEVQLLPALSYEDARDNYEAALYSASSYLTHAQDFHDLEPDWSPQEWREWLMQDVEHARKVFVLACHRAGIF